MRVVVLGAGALGSVYGAWLAEAGADVTLVARTPHAEAVRRDGLRVRSFDGTESVYAVHATDDPAAAGDADLVIVAAKSFDVPGLLDAYPGRVSMAFSLQNGVDQAEPLLERFGEAAVPGVAMVGGTLVSPGVAAYTFDGATYLGDSPRSAPGTAAAIAALLPDRFTERTDIASVLWSKATLAAAAMGVVALTRSIYHRMFVTPGTARGVPGPAARGGAGGPQRGCPAHRPPRPDAGPHVHDRAARGGAGSAAGVRREPGCHGQTQVKVSALQSIERGRPLEVDAVYAPLVRRAAERGLEVPLLAGVTRMMFGIDAALRGGAL